MPPQTFVLNANKEIVWQHVGFAQQMEDEYRSDRKSFFCWKQNNSIINQIITSIEEIGTNIFAVHFIFFLIACQGQSLAGGSITVISRSTLNII